MQTATIHSAWLTSADKIKQYLTCVKLDWQHIINKNICNKIEFHDGSRFVQLRCAIVLYDVESLSTYPIKHYLYVNVSIVETTFT